MLNDTTNLKLEQLTPLNYQKYFQKFFNLYAMSFPIEEQKNEIEINNMLKNNNYCFLLLICEETLYGFSIFYHSRNGAYAFLEYMAIEPTLKNGGLGTILLQKSFDKISQIFHTIPIFLEIEDPTIVNENQSIALKRLNFYKKNGCKVIEPFTYIQGLENGHIVPMKLLCYYPHCDFIIQLMLYCYVTSIYIEVYHTSCLNPKLDLMFNTNSPTIYNLY